MADDLSSALTSSANYVNPAYATPEQLAQLRAYSNELLSGKGQQPVHRWTQGLSNIVSALVGGGLSHQADVTQQQAAGHNAGDVSALIAQLQKGQPIDPTTAGRVYANPMAAPEHRALIGALVTPKVGEDVAGRPTMTSPAGGAQALPVGPGMQPGIRPGLSTPDASISAVPQAAPPISGAPPSMVPPPRMDAVSPQGGVFGGMNSRPADWNAPQGPAVPNTPMTLDQLAAKGRDFAAKRALTQGGAEAQTDVNKGDIQAAAAAPAVIKDLGVIKGIVQTSPGIAFGPTAQMTAEAKRVIANYAPGLIDEKSLAGADAIEKLNIGLAGQLAKSFGGTQGELFKAISATPGTEKSKQGTMVLIDLMQQKAMKDQQVGQLYRQLESTGQLQNYPAAREQFLTQHPVTNPLTGRPVEMDIAAARQKDAQGAFEKTATNPQTGEKLGLRNGRWEPIK
jgi:hypothetical protein